jgi:hypothetical protein
MKTRELFMRLIVNASSKKDIEKVFAYFEKKNIDLKTEIGDDYLRTAANKYFVYPD